MEKYLITVNHSFIVETDDLNAVLDNMEYTQFPEAKDYEFLEGSTGVETYND